MVEVVQFWQVGGELLCPPPDVADGEFMENPKLKALWLSCGEPDEDEASDASVASPGS